MELAICIISYNRPDSTHRVLRSISQCYYDSDKVDLIISIDNSGSNEVENVAQSFHWEFGDKRIVTHKTRLGLRSHVLEVGRYTEEYDGLIVLEDDIFVSPSFYLFAKSCVREYANNPMIAGISLYSFKENYHKNFVPFQPLDSDSDVYLMQNAQSWGQVWMKNQWREFMCWYKDHKDPFPEMAHLPKSICKWERSWLKYHTRYCIETNKYFIYPYSSFSTCCNDVGEHINAADNHLQVPLFNGIKKNFNLNPSITYDSFFENEVLYEIIGYSKKELCVDIYGEKENRLGCRYWLTRKKLPYKILASYAFYFRPVENNIILGAKGMDIFLYDTNERGILPQSGGNIEFLLYLYNYTLSLKKTLDIIKLKIKRRFLQ